MTLPPMTRQEGPPLLTLSGAVLEAQWDRVGHIIYIIGPLKKASGPRKKEKTAMSHFWDTHRIIDNDPKACGAGSPTLRND